MLSQSFLNQREKDWTHLQELIDSVDTLPASSIPDSFWKQLRKETRRLRMDLLLLEMHPLEEAQLAPLRSLYNQCNDYLQGTPLYWGQGLFFYFRHLLPFLLRYTWRAHALSAIMLLSGLLVGFLVFWLSPHAMTVLRPRGIDAFIAALKVGRIGEGAQVFPPLMFAGMVFLQNLRAVFLAFAFGLTYGIGTFFILFYNGLLLGAYAGSSHHYGMAGLFWPMILPHGILELAAFSVAGGTGLLLARAMLSPHNRGTLSSIRSETKVGLFLMSGVVPVLLLTGLLEGFLSLNASLPPALKWMTGIFFFLFLLFFCLTPFLRNES